MATKVQQKIPPGMRVQVPQTNLPNRKEPLKSQNATAKPLGSPTKQDVGCFKEAVGFGAVTGSRRIPSCTPTPAPVLPGVTWGLPDTRQQLKSF